MKLYQLLLILSASAFFSCAVQSPPGGGPVYDESLVVLNVFPISNSNNIINEKEKIKIYFNQMLNPQTVKNSFSVYPETDIDIDVSGNKVEITPKDNWPNSYFNIISKRDITDYYDNKLDQSIYLSYSTVGNIPKYSLSGNIVNFDSTKFYEVALCKKNNSDEKLKLISKIQSDYNGRFIFNNIESSEYILVAVEGEINNLYNDIRNFNYCVNVAKKINNNGESSNNFLYIHNPAAILDIKSLNIINPFYGEIILSDGSKRFFISNNDVYDGILHNTDFIKLNYPVALDSINVALQLKNNVETYNANKTFSKLMMVKDTLRPSIISHDFIADTLLLNFSEAIMINDVKNKESWSYKYDIINPLNVKFYNISDSITTLKIIENHIVDLMNNSLSDSVIYLNRESSNNNLFGGDLYGEVLYKGNNDVIVELKNNLISYKTYVNNDKFNFININPGYYKIWAYESINKNNDNYFNGKLEPLQTSAKFNIYKDEIEIRSKWDIEGIKIKID